MKPLKANYRIFEFLAICPSFEQRKWKKLLELLILRFCLTMFFITFIAGSTFFFEKILTDLIKALAAFFQISAAITIFYVLIIANTKRNELKDIFTEFQAFYDACKIFINFNRKFVFTILY